MKIVFLDVWAFIVLRDHELMCFGTKRDVDNSQPDEIGRMVLEAAATAEYHEIDRKRQRIAH